MFDSCTQVHRFGDLLVSENLHIFQSYNPKIKDTNHIFQEAEADALRWMEIGIHQVNLKQYVDERVARTGKEV